MQCDVSSGQRLSVCIGLVYLPPELIVVQEELIFSAYPVVEVVVAEAVAAVAVLALSLCLLIVLVWTS